MTRKKVIEVLADWKETCQIASNRYGKSETMQESINALDKAIYCVESHKKNVEHMFLGMFIGSSACIGLLLITGIIGHVINLYK